MESQNTDNMRCGTRWQSFCESLVQIAQEELRTEECGGRTDRRDGRMDGRNLALPLPNPHAFRWGIKNMRLLIFHTDTTYWISNSYLTTLIEWKLVTDRQIDVQTDGERQYPK